MVRYTMWRDWFIVHLLRQSRDRATVVSETIIHSLLAVCDPRGKPMRL